MLGHSIPRILDETFSTKIGDKVKIEAYGDSDFAGNKDKRCLGSGFLYMMNGAVLILKRSKHQYDVALSSMEAEYDVLCEVAT